MIKLTIISLTMFMSIGANLSDGIMHRLGFDPDILLVALVAFVVAGMIYHRNIALVVLVVLMTAGANVSEQTALSIGYNPDYLLAGLIALVVAPFVCNQLEGGIF
jgi:hypothetical protein